MRNFDDTALDTRVVDQILRDRTSFLDGYIRASIFVVFCKPQPRTDRFVSRRQVNIVNLNCVPDHWSAKAAAKLTHFYLLDY